MQLWSTIMQHLKPILEYALVFVGIWTLFLGKLIWGDRKEISGASIGFGVLGAGLISAGAVLLIPSGIKIITDLAGWLATHSQGQENQTALALVGLLVTLFIYVALESTKNTIATLRDAEAKFRKDIREINDTAVKTGQEFDKIKEELKASGDKMSSQEAEIRRLSEIARIRSRIDKLREHIYTMERESPLRQTRHKELLVLDAFQGAFEAEGEHDVAESLRALLQIPDGVRPFEAKDIAAFEDLVKSRFPQNKMILGLHAQVSSKLVGPSQ